MKTINLLAAIILMAASPHVLSAEDIPNIVFTDRFDVPAPNIIIKSIYDFERELSVRVKRNPEFEPSEVLIKKVTEYQMSDANGVVITSGFDIDVEHNVVLAYSGGTSEIINSNITPNGLQVISNFRDRNGQFISPPESEVALYNTTGSKLCFEYENVDEFEPDISITLLLDRSGSMSDEINSVISAADTFLNALPSSANCAVASFNTSWTYGYQGFQSCNTGDYKFDNIVAGGGTDIYAPLKNTYERYSLPDYSGHQKATFIVTDGYTLADEERKAELLQLKQNVLTLVYFVGGNRRNELEGITDHFIAQDGNITQSINQYFKTLSNAFNTQKSLTVQSCRQG